MTATATTTVDNGAAPTAVLQADNITVRFGGITALADVSLTVPPASIIGLVGPNGAGKSTMFAALSGLLRPNSGRVYLAGEDVTAASPQARARMGLARTFQQVELFLGLTVQEHLILAHRIRYARQRLWADLITWRSWRAPDATETEHVQMLLDMLGLTDVAAEPVAGLPLGIARRVEMGRALACSPTLLLLDEPFSGLDVKESEQVLTGLVRTVREHKVSLLLVEHDVEVVLGVSSNVYVLDFGVLIASGPPEDIRND
ncbi:MAG TPA: ABC transporter ATP-binding protein [Acidimicrobiales bacterium]|nr:ABC transporter ATP-binding protein [Acidimicrobiales bacterium]